MRKTALFHALLSTATTKRGMRRLRWVILPVLAGPVFAQVDFPNCTVDGYEWVSDTLLILHSLSFRPFPISDRFSLLQSYNSLNQNPCNVAAMLESTCYAGSEFSCPSTPHVVMVHFSEFTIPRLQPSWDYTGPNLGEDNLCQCNTIVYSLVSACGGCQGSTWISYAFYPTHENPR